ncbi:hypothetical protein GCM10007304_40710 [Rhodococcoides trifolii]|uniref:Uncharacterized protein n=1 Tax=Rhodococcoides trifolii TaxID=908250 RepID=A0A917LGN2_9NOCA|nr:protealysin inhibitor emfourin [Rhodococcus trifolii]GGG22763.1 hypothetical protein GCM10007304_40710 [Rhodococcus trifolii]
MDIVVVRSGGVAGMTRRGAVNLEQLGERAPEWHSLVQESLPILDRLAEEPAPHRVPDGFVWQIGVGDRSCEMADSYLTGPLRELAERTLREGRR